MASQMIDGVEFLLDTKPVRDVPKEHECVCLIEQKFKDEDGNHRTARDKYHQTVENPDQPFCTECENDGHPEAHNQVADLIKLTKEN